MTESEHCPNVIANFWEWHRRQQERAHGPIARLALDKCEETFRCSDWDRFGFWFAVYRRERPHSPNLNSDSIRPSELGTAFPDVAYWHKADNPAAPAFVRY